MAGGAYLAPVVRDSSRRVDKYGRANNTVTLFAIHVFFSPSPIPFHDLMVRVTEQFYFQLVFSDEFSVALGIVGTTPNHDGVKLFELRKAVGKFTCLGRATWGIVSRIKIQYDPFTEQVVERNRLLILVG